MRQPAWSRRRAHATVLAVFAAALALAGCATPGRVHGEAPAPASSSHSNARPQGHASHAPARYRAERRAGGITEEGLRSFLQAEAARRDLAEAQGYRVLAGGSTRRGRRLGPLSSDLDPITESMARLPDGHRWFPDVLAPSADAVDLGRLGSGTLSGRTWERDQDVHGVGLGYRAALGGAWHAAAEIGVAPFDDLADGSVTVLVGVGRRL